MTQGNAGSQELQYLMLEIPWPVIRNEQIELERTRIIGVGEEDWVYATRQVCQANDLQTVVVEVCFHLPEQPAGQVTRVIVGEAWRTFGGPVVARRRNIGMLVDRIVAKVDARPILIRRQEQPRVGTIPPAMRIVQVQRIEAPVPPRAVPAVIIPRGKRGWWSERCIRDLSGF